MLWHPGGEQGGILTQEFEFGREGQGRAVGHKCVVSLILRVDIINHQSVEPKGSGGVQGKGQAGSPWGPPWRNMLLNAVPVLNAMLVPGPTSRSAPY